MDNMPNPLAPLGRLKVLKAGVLSLIQDQGRVGFQYIGVGTSGVVDPWCAGWANRLVGNAQSVALLELTHGGLHAEVTAPTVMALTGSAIPFHINGQPARLWQSYPLLPGDRLQIGQQSQQSEHSLLQPGLRHYLAIRGGFQIAPVLGSVSANLREGTGGLDRQGGALKTGGQLPYFTSLAQTRLMLPTRKWHWWESDVELLSEQHLRVIPCAQYHAFPKAMRQQLLSGQYTIAQQSNRMGYRLEGGDFKHSLPGMLSEATGLGAIQMPNGGTPIVLLNDRQTLGGYPKLGAVTEIDCWRLGQMRPGQTLRFQLTSIVRAQRAKSALLERIATLRLHSY